MERVEHKILFLKGVGPLRVQFNGLNYSSFYYNRTSLNLLNLLISLILIDGGYVGWCFACLLSNSRQSWLIVQMVVTFDRCIGRKGTSG